MAMVEMRPQFNFQYKKKFKTKRLSAVKYKHLK